MVSTRKHPSEFEGTPAPTSAPSSVRSRASDAASPTPSSTTSSSQAVANTSRRATKNAVQIQKVWSHTPSLTTLAWLAVSLPLVIWDTGYVLGRPHTMPGGWLHWPLWTPYALYGTVDYVYGFPALEAHSGFTAAQGALNAVETLGYFWYLWIVLRRGVTDRQTKGRGAPASSSKASAARVVEGRDAAVAVLLGFGVSLMTLSKTVLYWLNEYYSGFANIGHNSIVDLIPLWIIPNGAWLVLPSYMIYVFGAEILQGLQLAAGVPAKKTS